MVAAGFWRYCDLGYGFSNRKDQANYRWCRRHSRGTSIQRADRASRAREKGPPVPFNGGTAVAKESKPPKEKVSKALPANPPAPKAVSAVSKSGPHYWEDELWTKQSRFAGGGGGGSQ